MAGRSFGHIILALAFILMGAQMVTNFTIEAGSIIIGLALFFGGILWLIGR